MAGSRLTQFSKISAADWDILEQIKTNKGPINLLNIEMEYPSKIKRTFCKCGYASGRLEDTCPDCGNSNKKKISYSSYRYSKDTIASDRKLQVESIISKKKKTYEDRVVGYENNIYLSVDTTTNEYEISESGYTKLFEIGEFEAEDYTSSRYSSNFNFDFKDFMVFYPYDTNGLSKLSSGANTISGLIKFINYREEMPVVMNNINKYPGIVNAILSLASTTPFETISDWNEVYPILGIPKKELYPYIEALVSNGSGHYYYGYSHSSILKAFDSYNKMDEEKKKIAEYFLIHGGLGVSDFTNLTEQLLTDISSSEVDVLMSFARANYVSYGISIISKYKEKKKFLDSKGIDVNIASIDTRNYNLLKNKDYMTTHQKYNEKRVSYFLEMFDMNPLESLKYLDSRRAPNKDLRKELADKLD